MRQVPLRGAEPIRDSYAVSSETPSSTQQLLSSEPFLVSLLDARAIYQLETSFAGRHHTLALDTGDFRRSRLDIDHRQDIRERR
jgi:hypothetical protein